MAALGRKFTTRLALKKLAREGKLDKSQVRAILKDDDKLGALIEAVDGEVAAEQLFAGEDGPVISFLKYLLDNPDKLKALIEIIMSLFAGE